jgi:hypothetical protein
MPQKLRFRRILPVAQFGLAALFGGLGLWQRFAILSRPFGEGQTVGDTTAQFHIWPWPFRFAVITNMPAFLAWALLGWPIGERWPTIPEAAMFAPMLLFVAMLWYWVGSRLDRRWYLVDKTPWIALLAFTVVSLAGAFLRIGYTDYLPYGFVLWAIAALALACFARIPSGSVPPHT